MKILVFCSDLLPLPGLPTTGGGLRCWQLIRSLEQAGHEVVTSMPLFTFLAKQCQDDIPEQYKLRAWIPTNQQEIFDQHRPDAVLFTSTWIVDHLGPVDAYRIYDLDGPQLLEMHYKNDLDHSKSTDRKIERLSTADFVFCAGERQRYYFWPFLLLAGHQVPTLSDIPVIPIAFVNPLETYEISKSAEIIVAGGFYPWQDPRPGLLALEKFLESASHKSVNVRIIGTSHEVTGEDERQFQQIRRTLGRFSNVTFCDFVSHKTLTEWCRKATLALEIHERNPERELAITTRTVDALSCGLPVMYNDYAELSDQIRDYKAGWCFDPRATDPIVAQLHKVADDPECVAELKANAQQLILDKYWGPAPAKPLIDFLASPTHREPSTPARLGNPEIVDELQHLRSELSQIQSSKAFRFANLLSKMKRYFRQ